MSGHWYKKDGSPCHYQPDGSNTTLRHARKQDLVPSVTGILDIVDKPGLTNYLINQHLEAAWESDWSSDYLGWSKAVREQASQHATTARDKGTAIHHALDCYYGDTTEDIDPDLNKYVAAVSQAVNDVYGLDAGQLVSEKTFSTEYYGGAVDLSHPTLVADFKYKTDGWDLKKDGTPKKIWYDNHVGQISAYKRGLGLPEAVCANIFIGPKAEVYIKEWTPEEVEEGFEYFQACYRLWNCKNRLFK